MMTRFLIAIFVVFSIASYFIWYENSPKPLTFAEEGSINIGIAWPTEGGLFIKGAKMAVKDANEAGGVLGKKIRLVIDEREQVVVDQLKKSSSLSIGENIKEYSRQIARDFIYHSDQISAIVGHRYSFFSFSAANIYQQKKRVYIAPVSTNMLLLSMEYHYTFRMLPNNLALGKQLAEYSHQQGYKRIAIFNERSEYALELSMSIAQYAAQNHNIKTVIHDSFFSNMSERDITNYAVQFRKLHKKESVDAIFIVSGSRLALNIFREFRKRGIKDIPFIGGEGLDTHTFWNKIKGWAEKNQRNANFMVPTIFHAESPSTQGFVERFQYHYGEKPDRFAAIAYDSINVILRAIGFAQSSDPTKIADEMHFMSACNGLSGPVKFADNGDVPDKKYIIKSYTRKGFQYRNIEGDIIKDIRKEDFILKCTSYDQDGDGILNKFDQCPDSSEIELSQGIFQQGKKLGCPMDFDDDGVPDYRDKMPKNILDELVRGVDDFGQPVDQDNDSIPDYRDISPRDPQSSIIKGVNSEGLPNDEDNDKVPDYRDQCPSDTQFMLSKGINQQGCPVDTDADGMANYEDSCPNDTAVSMLKGINEKGCPIDSDGDNYADYLDKCPQDSVYHTRHGVDLQGCPIDKDQDGIPDYNDACSGNSPLEISAGVTVNGCPQDRDQDQVPDYKDACPMDSTQDMSKGIDETGCPLDDDQDQVLNVYDLCLDTKTSSKTYGVTKQGCDIDIDEDGVADYIDMCLDSFTHLKVDNTGCASIETQLFLLDSTFKKNTDQRLEEGKTVWLEYVDNILFDVALIEDLEIVLYSNDKKTIRTKKNKKKRQPVPELQAKRLVEFFVEQGVNESFIHYRIAREKESRWSLDELNSKRGIAVHVRGVTLDN